MSGADPLEVVVVGGGIAGLSLALALRRRGHRPTVVERAPGLRDAGYMMDFFGPGFTAAERLELLPELARIHFPIDRLAFVDRDAERFALPYPLLRRRWFADRHFNFLRGDLERVLYERIRDEVEVRFGSTVVAWEDGGDRLAVTLDDGTALEADALVGADGVHSALRERLFATDGPGALRRLGLRMAAWVLADPELGERIGASFQTLTVPGRQVSVYPIRGGRLATFFLAEDGRGPAPGSAPPAAVLAATYGDLGWVVPRLLAGLPTDGSLLHDEVEQVELPRWTRGRVGLLGDAAGCVSPLAGEGASLAMAAGWVLAEELDRSPGDVAAALERYADRVRPRVVREQASGRRIARWFVPPDRLRLTLRDLVLRASLLPPVAALVRRGFAASAGLLDGG